MMAMDFQHLPRALHMLFAFFTLVSLAHAHGTTTWHTGADTLVMTCTDQHSGCNEIRYCSDTVGGTSCTGSWTGYNQCASAPSCPTSLPVTADGITYVYFFSIDTATNQENTMQKAIIMIDSVAPQPSVQGAPAAWQSTGATAAVGCTDPKATGVNTVSGCDSSTYKLKLSDSNQLCPTDYASYTAPTPQAISTPKWVCATAKDAAGNIGTTASPVQFRVDQTAPSEGSVTYRNDYQTTTAIAVTVNRGSDAESGMSSANADYRLDAAAATLSPADGTCGTFGSFSDAGVSETAAATSYSYTGTNGRCYKFQYHVKNVAGLETIYQSSSVTKIDTVAPSGGSISYTNGYETDTTAEVPLAKGTDSESGIASAQLFKKEAVLANDACVNFDASWQQVTGVTADTTTASVQTQSGKCYKFRYVVTDRAGLEKEYLYKVSGNDAVLKVDTSKPATTAAISTGTAGQHGWYTSDLTLTFTCTDAGASKCQSIRYCMADGTGSCTPAAGAAGTTTLQCPATGACTVAVAPAADARLSQEGIRTVVFTSRNTAGSDQEPAPSPVAIKIDKTQPQLSALPEPPGEVSYRTGVSISSTGSDAISGISRHVLRWKENSAPFEKDCGTAASCTATFTKPATTTIEYWSEITDVAGLVRTTEATKKRFQVCGLTGTTITAQCSSGNPALCEPGEKVAVDASYTGACPLGTNNLLIAVNATSGDEACSTNASFAPQGLRIACTRNDATKRCTGEWTIPAETAPSKVPVQCRGKTLTARSAELFKASGNDWFDKASPTGRFRFYIGAVTLVPSLVFTKTNPNLNEAITAQLSCAITAGTETTPCTPATATITTFAQKLPFIRDFQYYKDGYVRREGGNFDTDASTIRWDAASKRYDLPLFTGTKKGAAEQCSAPADTCGYNAGPNTPPPQPDESLVTMEAAFDYRDPVAGGESIATGATTAGFSVNFPPEPGNLEASPRKVTRGNDVVFSATVTDPEVNDFSVTIGLCQNADCTQQLPVCQFPAGPQRASYTCAYNTMSLGESAHTFFVQAQDANGASQRETHPFDVVGESLEIQLIFPAAEKKLIPLKDGNPDFTKTMPIDVTIAGRVRGGAGNPGFLQDCTRGACEVTSVTVGSAPFSKVAWNDLAVPVPGWDASTSSRQLSCDTVYRVTAVVEVTAGPLAGLGNSKAQDIHINCNPKITIEPTEIRLVAGQNNREAFVVQVWDPSDDAAKRYAMDMKPDDAQQELLWNWLSFDCTSFTATCEPLANGNFFTIRDMQRREDFTYAPITVRLTAEAASRAGVYPVKFSARASPEITGIGTILVFKEGLSEFSTVQLLAMLALAAPLFLLAIRGKPKHAK
ncbi:MAG: hypothetical protein HYY37_03565 [Candidatus Aenigmarchaeota archaeon]|nr:hypothetical protein [Candidatus Aenigmarchaeota archaeon]